jgi:hypothetical protein
MSIDQKNEQIFSDLGKRIGKIVQSAVRQAFALQGHDLTGALSKSIKYEVEAKTDSAKIEFMLLNYGMVLNYGVTPARIPFTSGSGAKGSKYIDGLKMFAKFRFGADEKTATRIAFAIAHKHKKYGMPIDKRKTKAIFNALESVDDKLKQMINDAMEQVCTLLFVSAFTDVAKKDSNNIKIEINL